MPTEQYTVVYVADPSAFVAGARVIETHLKNIDALAEKSKASLAGFAGGGSRSAANATKRLNELEAALNGVTTAGNQAGAALNNVHVSNGKAAGSAKDLGTSMTSFFGAGMAIRGVTALIERLSTAIADALKHLNEGAELGLSKRDQAREYANLLGKNGPDDETMARLFDVSKSGGMTYKETLQYAEQFMGSLPAGKQKGHVTDDQAKILEAQGAAFGSRIGLDAATAGDLTGVIPQYVDLTKGKNGKPLTTEQGVDKALGQLGALAYGLNEGRGKVTTLARSELGAAASALASGHISDHAEMGAFAGVASTFSKTASSSGTAFKQMDRLVNEGMGEEGEWLQSIGVADAKGDLGKLRALKTHIDAQRKASKEPDKFDSKKYLQSKGFRENGELDSTLAYLDNLDVLDQRVAKARTLAGDGASVRKSNREFANTLTGQNRAGIADEEIGNYLQTQKRQRRLALRKGAYGELEAEGSIDSSRTNWGDSIRDINPFAAEYSKNMTIDDRVIEKFKMAAVRGGIYGEVLQKYPLLGLRDTNHDHWAKMITSEYGNRNLDNILNEYGPRLEAMGINIGEQGSGTIKAGIDGMKALKPVAGRLAPEAAAAAAKAAGAGLGGAGGPRASADGGGMDRASGKLEAAADAILTAARQMRDNSGPGLSGGYDPYRA